MFGSRLGAARSGDFYLLVIDQNTFRPRAGSIFSNDLFFQCLKLAKHDVSACFLGSGQPDNSVEKKAMEGKYGLIYVCPETVLRLIKPLQSLAAGRGIALFAIDEVHCVSKWGHDFRPDYRKLSVLKRTSALLTSH